MESKTAEYYSKLLFAECPVSDLLKCVSDDERKKSERMTWLSA